MEKITLVCSSLNPDIELLQRMLRPTTMFDKVIIHLDSCEHFGGIYFTAPSSLSVVPTIEHFDIGEAYNLLIERVETEWICCFCDDDFFYPEALKAMIDEIHKGIDADVAHFNFRVSGYCPPQDKRAWIFGKEYILCEKQPITAQLLGKHNRLPAGSFFRKSAWEKAGKFQGNKCHDWYLWLRMAKSNLKFKYFNHLVYNYQRRENSAWISQNKI